VSQKKREPLLSDKLQRFIELRVRGMDKKPAALAAGYSESYSNVAGRLEKNPTVREAIDAIRQKGCEMAAYDLTKAMEEAQEVIEYAKQVKSAMAYVRAVELRARLAGLLIEQIHLKHQEVDLRSALEAARVRMINSPLALTQRVHNPFDESPEGSTEDQKPKTSA
jgi:hypothetical protein